MDLTEIFQDTLYIASSLRNKTLTHKHTTQEIISPKGSYDTNIVVENLDTVSSIQKWSLVGKTCALNMASPKRPGGGVRNGARAQEECLFRCSNLIMAISPDFYPLSQYDSLYTQRAIFFKDKNYNLMDNIECDVITIAALNLNLGKPNNYEEITKDKIRLMLSIPYLYGAENLILGAWGCGVFDNDPTTMATYFKEILINENYSKLYKTISFSIINDHNSVGSNFEIFNQILNEK
jgi:uncharacterized protein (TIGR02452 family)